MPTGGFIFECDELLCDLAECQFVRLEVPRFFEDTISLLVENFELAIFTANGVGVAASYSVLISSLVHEQAELE